MGLSSVGYKRKFYFSNRELQAKEPALVMILGRNPQKSDYLTGARALLIFDYIASCFAF
jgi:hypothetical protein